MPSKPSGPDNLLTVDLAAIAANLAALRALLPPGLRLAGVVKAQAYGHGLLPVARTLKKAGAEALAVATLEEGLTLRKAGIQGPIYLLLGLRPGQARQVAKHDLTPISGDLEALEALSHLGQALGRRLPVQFKVDTGMGRLGVRHEEAWPYIETVAALPGLELTGLVSHLASAGNPDSASAHHQAQAFADLLALARARGLPLKDSSLSGSGGTMVPPGPGLGQHGLVRLGMAIYGALPDPASAGRVSLKPAMSFCSRLLAVRRAPKGTAVSYGSTWRAHRDTWLGVVPLGYANGYLRAASNHAHMLVNGQPAPVRGRVCMNLTVLEVGHLDPLPRVGDPVAALGSQGEQAISAEQLAQWCGTIPYEITCALGAANKIKYV